MLNTIGVHKHILIQTVIVLVTVGSISLLSLPWAFYVIIYSLAALALNILVGYTGYLSLGHSSFFGLGVYCTGLTLHYINLPPDLRWISILVALPLSLLVALGMGAVVVKDRVAAPILMLAGSEILYFMLLQLKDITYGDQGIGGIPRPTIGNSQLTMIQWYFIYFIVFTVCYMSMRILVSSHFGKLLVATRSNEERIKFLGYNVFRTKLIAFLFSAAFTTLAGSLYVIYMRYAGLGSVSLSISFSLLFMVILGGTRTFNGPVLGAIIYVLMQDIISRYTTQWPFIVGMIFIIILRLGRGGVLDIITGIIKRMTGREIDA